MNSLLRNVNDMGELRSEHPRTFGAWMRFLGMWSICCMWIVAFAYLLLFEPKEEVLMVYTGWAVCCFWILVTAFTIRLYRKIPALFALYEKGLVIVYRNRTIRRIFWDDINKVQCREERYMFYSEPLFLGITLHIQPDTARPVVIKAIFFQDAEKLYRSICEAKGVA